MKYLSYSVALNCFRIAQMLSPFLSGNLRYNAMYPVMVSNGFDIVYDDRFAHYIDFLEIEGLGSSDKHTKFIEVLTFNEIVRYLEFRFNKKGTNPFNYGGRSADSIIYNDYITTDPEIREAVKRDSMQRYGVV